MLNLTACVWCHAVHETLLAAGTDSNADYTVPSGKVVIVDRVFHAVMRTTSTTGNCDSWVMVNNHKVTGAYYKSTTSKFQQVVGPMTMTAGARVNSYLSGSSTCQVYFAAYGRTFDLSKLSTGHVCLFIC